MVEKELRIIHNNQELVFAFDHLNRKPRFDSRLKFKLYLNNKLIAINYIDRCLDEDVIIMKPNELFTLESFTEFMNDLYMEYGNDDDIQELLYHNIVAEYNIIDENDSYGFLFMEMEITDNMIQINYQEKNIRILLFDFPVWDNKDFDDKDIYVWDEEENENVFNHKKFPDHLTFKMIIEDQVVAYNCISRECTEDYIIHMPNSYISENDIEDLLLYLYDYLYEIKCDEIAEKVHFNDSDPFNPKNVWYPEIVKSETG
jgi:hypothetical protein